MKKLYPFAAMLILSCAEPPAATHQAVVYGVDGRTEVFAHGNAALVAVARESIAMKVRTTLIDDADPAAIGWDYTRTLGEAKNLCAGERFADQIEPGVCSGTLIDSQHILTAGHCMDTPEDCTDYSWVLGFHYDADGVLAPLTSDDVYHCGAVVAQFNDNRVDYAVVRLARPVVGHPPARIRMAASALPRGTPVALIGHPNGIPMKIDDTGTVTFSSAAASWFRATVDAFNGNSGSGTFDHEGNLVGVLGGGATDYADMGGCNIVNVISPPPTDDGERLTYVRPALAAFCAVPGVSSSLCECGGEPCIPALPHDRCGDAERLSAESQTIDATLTGYAPWERGSCGGNGPERVYTFSLTETSRFTATAHGFDTALYLRRSACDGVEIACNDDINTDTDRGSSIGADLPAGDYFLFVDAYDGGIGDFSLVLQFGGVGADAGAGADAGTDASALALDGSVPDADVGDAGVGGVASAGCNAGARGTPPAPWPLGLIGAVVFLRRRRR